MPKNTAKKSKPKKPKLTAKTANKHDLYERSVQNVEAEVDFIDKVFKKLRKRHASRMREDFCGTGNTAAEWVRRRKDNEAWGLDIDRPTIDWGMERHINALNPDQQSRIHLLERDVLHPEGAVEMDCVLAMNFSYWLFHTRAELKRYFESVRDSLKPDGVFFMDFYGGSEAMLEVEEDRKLRGFTYVWEQDEFNPITGRVMCYIHFDFPDGTRMKRAFTYDWRVWGLPELRELLAECGFGPVTVYWEGDDGDGGGNGIFKPTMKGEACETFVCYIVAERAH